MRIPGLAEQVIDLIYPSACAGCGKACVRPVCDTCFIAIVRKGAGPGHERFEPAAGHSFRDCRAVGDYAGPLKDMVLRLKDSEKRVAGPLASLMVMAAGNDPDYILPEAVCYVPSTRRKIARRGYNPAEVLAAGFASRLGLPLIGALRVARRVADQDSVPGRQRWANVEGAFSPALGVTLSGNVLLVDDVLTTGATAMECSRLLLGLGAASVHVLVATRAVLYKSPDSSF